MAVPYTRNMVVVRGRRQIGRRGICDCGWQGPLRSSADDPGWLAAAARDVREHRATHDAERRAAAEAHAAAHPLSDDDRASLARLSQQLNQALRGKGQG